MMKPIEREVMKKRMEYKIIPPETVHLLHDEVMAMGEIELIPVVRVAEDRQVIEVCMRRVGSKKLYGVVYECKNLLQARYWMERFNYVVSEAYYKGGE